MAVHQIPPPPRQDKDFTGHVWQEWFRQLHHAEMSESANTFTTTVSLDFASINANTTGVVTATVTGALPDAGQVVLLGPPSTLEADLVFCGFVSAADTVTIRMHNSRGSAVNPAAANWTITVEG